MNKLRYVLSTIVGIAIVGGTAFASQNSKPGDVLFPVKKATEQVQVSLTANETSKAQLQAKFAQERLDELNEIEKQDETQAGQPAASSDAQTQAKTEVSNAITQLTQVQADLQAKGDVQAAAAIGDTIARLKAKLNDKADMDENETGEDHGDQDKNNQGNQNNQNNQNNQGNNGDNDQHENEQHGGSGSDDQNEHSGNTGTQLQINGNAGVHFDDGSSAEAGE